MKPAESLLPISILLAALAVLVPAGAQAPLDKQVSERTVKRLREKGWWPTRTDAARKEFAGTEACAACHTQKVRAQQQTSMARAASRASETEVLRSNLNISLDSPPFQTLITREGKGSTYTVKRGGEAMSGQLLWSMGDGVMGRTFILESGGSLFESQLTYFPSIGGLDLTPGHSRADPRDLEHAFGERQGAETAQHCFACHTSGSSMGGQFEPARATPGVTCEACHGPGARHVKAMQENKFAEGRAAIVNPASFDPVKIIDFCGACHRAPMDVAAAKDYVPINVRFQPYRLSKSRCWSRPDDRITCIACHDPHEQLVRDLGSYDEKCLACHGTKIMAPATAGGGPPAAEKLPACPVSTSHCVSCHMPQYKVPQMHGSFTDHDIRIVRPGDPYPL